MDCGFEEVAFPESVTRKQIFLDSNNAWESEMFNLKKQCKYLQTHILICENKEESVTALGKVEFLNF